MSDSPNSSQKFTFVGMRVPISCHVRYDLDSGSYVANNEHGWLGFSDRSAESAALNCFRALLLGEGAYYVP